MLPAAWTVKPAAAASPSAALLAVAPSITNWNPAISEDALYKTFPLFKYKLLSGS